MWFLQLIYWKIQFWCCPGVGHLHPIFKQHRGVFVWTPGPTMGHLQLSFQKQMTKWLARTLSSSEDRTLSSKPLIFFFPSSSSPLLVYYYLTIYTWSYENRVSKHFVIFLNFPCLIACLLCCLLMSCFFLLVLWLGICVEVDVDRITILPSPTSLFFPYPQFFVQHKWQLFSSLVLVIGHLEKSFPESIM